ncbi:MAG: rhomboid family intramembrane serine protease [Deltaproteobacteria bacterium]|jgi:GlpG protein|nr:rhomboid family intramembrane serine protease [Deltaproteobacteria bacterium]MBW2530151.1 rhomboid family intramembrane serine protease [Deltaproteobacteria bacterium]
MRQLAEFEDSVRARALCDVLVAAGIDCTVDEGRDGASRVWVHDERRMNEAAALATDFEAAPEAARFADAPIVAADKRKAERREAHAAKRRVVVVRERFGAAGRYGPLTLGLIALCVVVAFFTTTQEGILRLQLGDRIETVRWLAFQSYVEEGGYYRWRLGLPDLLGGQLWRVFTPMLLHFGVFHLLFNMWWLRDLGTFIEKRQSSLFFALMVVVLSGSSNAAQFLVRGSPAFGGMSGVVYGLFAYIWIRGRFDPQSGYQINPSAVYWMVGFYVVCWTGLVGPVANVAHTAGLVLGAAWGWLAAGGHRRLPFR